MLGASHPVGEVSNRSCNARQPYRGPLASAAWLRRNGAFRQALSPNCFDIVDSLAPVSLPAANTEPTQHFFLVGLY